VRVLVVDEDPTMREKVVNYLEGHNIKSVAASGRQDIARSFANSEPSLVILDLGLGQEKGLDLMREIRSCSEVPVIITTEHLCNEFDRVVGPELGADDYTTKPLGLRELLARIRAVLRRCTSGRAVSLQDRERHRYQFGG
jgi:two-component system, OmpR family, response regulator